jgi:hypothetical protein
MNIQATAISIKVVPASKSGKVEYERESGCCMGIAKNFIKPFALVFDFSALLEDNFN